MSVSPAPTRVPSRETRSEYTVIEGPRWYQHRIRSRGPAVALVVPGVLGVVAFLSLQISDSSWSGLVGLIGGYFAAPALLVVGAPFAERGLYPIAVLISAAMWLIVGFVAARRATRNPMASWTDFWRHYLAMLVGIWCGVAIALIVATIQIGSGVVDWT